jgi:deoxyhypusine synthase
MSIYENIKPIKLNEINTYELASRPSKVTVKDFAEPISSSDSLKDFLDKLPNILAVQSIREIASRIRRAKDLGKPIIWGIGGHVVKTGVAPIMIDLMNRGFVTAIAGNGSVLVHDTEIALVGFTSEDVDATLGEGDFGASKETGEILNSAAKSGQKDSIGLGEAMSREVTNLKPEFGEKSLLYNAYKNKIPFTAHSTIGADIGHFHASASGSALGETSHTDFRLFTSLVKEMNGGGVYLNIGSAVTMPEIFLKAVTVVKNLGYDLEDITTANFDFIQQYRPNTNVVRRPTANGKGRGFSVTGHHELLIPLLAAQILCGD